MVWVNAPVTGARFGGMVLLMSNFVGLALFALGIVLLVFGFNASHSFSSDLSRAFTGNPTDRSLWLLAGGGAAVVFGLFLAIRGAKRS